MTYIPRASLHGVDLSGPTAKKPSKGPVGSTWLDETKNDLYVQTTSGTMAKIGRAVPGETYFVDGTDGLDTNDGTSWSDAFLTIAAAVTEADAGDTILMRGTFTEDVTIAVGKTGLRIIGAGTCPRATRWNGKTAVNLTINATQVEVCNIYFSPKATASSSCIVLGGAGHARIYGNRFQGSTGAYRAIYSPVCDSDNVQIVGNEFFYFNTLTYGAAILGVEAGGLSYSGWLIQDNVFSSCVIAIDINGRVCNVLGNIIGETGITALSAVGAVLATGIWLNGTSSGGNQVHGNYLNGTYNVTLYKVGTSGDDWAGNYVIAGITAANPTT